MPGSTSTRWSGARAPTSLPRWPMPTGSIVRSETRVDRELLAAGPRLAVVARAGVGVDAIDVDAATDAGILVLNTPGREHARGDGADVRADALARAPHAVGGAAAARGRVGAQGAHRHGAVRQDARDRRARPHRRQRRDAREGVRDDDPRARSVRHRGARRRVRRAPRRPRHAAARERHRHAARPAHAADAGHDRRSEAAR